LAGFAWSMDKEKIIKITIALYRVTGLFPEREPLKFQIREKANQILSALIVFVPQKSQKTAIFRKIEQILALFRIAKSQKWADEKNFLVLERYYREIKQEIALKQLKISTEQLIEPLKVINLPPREKVLKTRESLKTQKFSKKEQKILKTKERQRPVENLEGSPDSPQERQKKIIEMLKEKEVISLQEIQQAFPEITSRTIRRDVSALMRNNVLNRKRESKKDVLFTLKEKK
jgi:hypothetical protein